MRIISSALAVAALALSLAAQARRVGTSGAPSPPLQGASTGNPQPAFEIADVHVSTDTGMYAMDTGAVVRGNRYELRDATMLDLVTSAYGVNADSVSGGPSWLDTGKYDVIARMPAGATPDSIKLMLQALLADRFQLVAHTGMAPVPRYVLAVAKGGSKLKPAQGTDNSGCQSQGPPNPDIHITCRNLTSADIADNLQGWGGGYLNHPVVDRTNLNGAWDFDLTWTPFGAPTSADNGGVSFIDAVEKQLGLTLTVQDLPEPAVTIVSVARVPTPNRNGVAAALDLGPAEFVAASIKPAPPDTPPNQLNFNYTGGSEIHATGSFQGLLALAMKVSLNLQNDLIAGLPKSTRTKMWTVVAKLPDSGEGAPGLGASRPTPPSLSVALDMLHTLLVQRFELKMHQENRELTVYALTSGGTPKLTRANPAERSGCNLDASLPPAAVGVTYMFRCTNVSMADLAEFIQEHAQAYIDHSVVDATGLQGGWDFVLGWTPRNILYPASPANPGQQAASPAGLSIFDAVDKELGLKIATERRTMPVWVVDHVDDQPIQ